MLRLSIGYLVTRRPEANPYRKEATKIAKKKPKKKRLLVPLLSAIMAIPVMIVAEIILVLSWLMLILPPFIPGLVPLFVLFGGRVPDGMYNFMRGGLRLAVRAQAYALMLVRPYPTFYF